ncbi:TnpV protein [Faecalibacterium sp.]|uniref:TnpV protein n=1 Tax=Faecalibacterium sp. TaxID=1971605 RepID=UPI00345DB0BE
MSRGGILTGKISATSLTSTPWRLSPCSVPQSAIFLRWSSGKWAKPSRKWRRRKSGRFAHLRRLILLRIIRTEQKTRKGATNMELTYTMQGDYLIPDLTVPESPKLGKYGMLRRTFLREHRDGIYTGMLLNGTLSSHLEEVDRQAQKMLDDLTEQMKALNGVTEQLKAEDQMRWVQMMNSIRHSAEEVILNDLIYA